MWCLLLVFLIESLFLSLLAINVENAEFASLTVIIVNTLILTSYVAWDKTIKYKNFILISYILKLAILFISFYDIFPIMFTGADSVRFDSQAFQIWQNPELLTTHKYGTLYQPFLGNLYVFIGPQKMVAMFFNVVLSIFGLICIDRIVQKFEVEDKPAMAIMAVLSLSPVAIILSSVLMRDALVTNCFIFSIYFFLLYTQEKKPQNIVLSLIFLFMASALHSGVFVFVIGILFYVFKERERSSALIKILCSVIILIGIYSFSDALFSKFSGLEKSESEIMEQLADARGGSAYLVGLQSNNIFVNLLFFPIKAVYFLFSPMLWDIRQLGDIIMILLDSVLYYFMTFSIIKVKACTDKRLRNAIAVGVIFVLFAFANGTHNSGTAARHRYKVLPAICMIYGLSNIKEDKDESESFGNSSCV